MKRAQLFEFEDQPWFPEWIRVCMTRLIVVFMRMVGGNAVLAARVEDALERSGARAIVDLGSGSGGAMPSVLAALREKGREVSLTMTDLYPSSANVEFFEAQGVEGMRYHGEPVDATSLASAPEGLKTMVNSFHHMPPDAARAILKSAHDERQPLLIYELGGPEMPLPLWWLSLLIGLPLTALTTWFLTPMVRPLTARQLFFTYVIPVIPFFYAWDGQASLPRMYREADMRTLLEGLDDGYAWEIEPAKSAEGKEFGYYVLGLPTA